MSCVSVKSHSPVSCPCPPIPLQLSWSSFKPWKCSELSLDPSLPQLFILGVFSGKGFGAAQHSQFSQRAGEILGDFAVLMCSRCAHRAWGFVPFAKGGSGAVWVSPLFGSLLPEPCGLANGSSPYFVALSNISFREWALPSAGQSGCCERGCLSLPAPHPWVLLGILVMVGGSPPSSSVLRPRHPKFERCFCFLAGLDSTEGAQKSSFCHPKTPRGVLGPLQEGEAKSEKNQPWECPGIRECISRWDFLPSHPKICSRSKPPSPAQLCSISWKFLLLPGFFISLQDFSRVQFRALGYQMYRIKETPPGFAPRCLQCSGQPDLISPPPSLPRSAFFPFIPPSLGA